MPRRDALRALLRAHPPADAREAEHRRRMLVLLDRAEPFARSSFAPGHFTASAFVLSPDERDLLLIHHAKLGIWVQPGGHVDPDDEDLPAAARREAAEETGIVELDAVGPGPLLDLDIHPIPPAPKKAEPAHEHFDVRVLLRARSRAFRAGSDARAARWVPLHEVEDAGTDDSVRRAVRKLLERA